MNLDYLQYEDNNSSRSMQGLRRLANVDACKFDLREVLPKLFATFESALAVFNEKMGGFRPHTRARNLEANVLQTVFAEKLFDNFGASAFFGAYHRLILRSDGYIILFKKLRKNGKPMNIKTNFVQKIATQQQTLDLFTDSDYEDEPILFFGYQKSRTGDFVNPQVVYIDQGEVIFSITNDEGTSIIPIIDNQPVEPTLIDVPRVRRAN
ncbi:hypothetical protein [Kaistella sp.]|uniref:hypothetical protein n=1 Tax=Kaistella sp. TaxID=2782235 RepID=UPI002F943155